jgi:hypothetical protein
VSLSVTDPIGQAFERTRLVLFQPFDFGKWLRLGFCAFLMGLAQGGGGGGGGTGSPPNMGGADMPDWRPVTGWIHEHLAIIILVASIVVALAILLTLLCTWLSSRGHFMFLDGVARNRGAVVEPWHEYRAEGNSLFAFRICLVLIGLLVVFLIGGLGVLVAWSDIQRQEFGPAGVGAIILVVMMLIGFALVMALVGLFLKDFVVPIMYLKRIGVLAAWGVFRDHVLAGNAGSIALYVLMKMALAVGAGMVAAMLMLLTCCLAALPYVGSVILLPVLVFLRAYSLYFLAQLGPKWSVFDIHEPVWAGEPV